MTLLEYLKGQTFSIKVGDPEITIEYRLSELNAATSLPFIRNNVNAIDRTEEEIAIDEIDIQLIEDGTLQCKNEKLEERIKLIERQRDFLREESALKTRRIDNLKRKFTEDRKQDEIQEELKDLNREYKDILSNDELW